MSVFHASQLYKQARSRAVTKKSMLIYAAVASGSILLFYLIGYLFDLLIANTGGLSGVATRSILSTAQTTLQIIIAAALPFWKIGIFYVALRWARNQFTETTDLLQGFRRFGSILRLRILYSLILTILLIGILNICSFIFSLTPFSSAFADAIAPLFDPSATAEQIDAIFTPEYLQSLSTTMIPFFILSGVVVSLVFVVIFYRLRLGEFAIVDGLGARKSLRRSLQATKGNWKTLLKLDLFFWWYYLLQGLCLVISNGNWLLPLLGIQLPMSENIAFFLFFGLGTALQVLLMWQFQGGIITSYALVYDRLCPRETAIPIQETT